MGRNKRINITIIILSSVTIFLQTLTVSLEDVGDSKVAEYLTMIINAALITIQTLQLNLKKIKEKEEEKKKEEVKLKEDTYDSYGSFNLPIINVGK